MRPTLAVAVHDGFYGCGTGAGHANHAFLSAVADLLPPEVELVVLPVRLSPDSPEFHSSWHADLPRAVVHPVDNGTGGRDRFGTLPHFRHLAFDTARVLREEVTGRPLHVVAFDVPFFGLAHVLPADTALTIVPRSTGLLHQPQDTERISWERAALRAAVRRGGRVASISRFMHGHLRRDYGVPDPFPLPDGLVRADWEITAPEVPHDGFLLSFGRAEPYKGFDDFLAALGMLRNSALPHVILAAVSEGPGLTPYQRHLAEGLRDIGVPATFLPDFTPRVRGLLAHPALRAVVVPSRSEPFGRIPIEAYAVGGGPVVATRTGGLTEQIRDAETGFLAAPGDSADLAAAIRRALDLGPAQRAEMRAAARELARDEYDYRTSIARFLRETGYRVAAA